MLGLVGLWSKVCNKQLPERCSKEWYFTTFCGCTKEQYRSKHSALDEDCNILHYLHGTVKPYDFVCFMLNLGLLHVPSMHQFVDALEVFDFQRACVTHNGSTHFFFIKSDQAPTADAVCDYLAAAFTSVLAAHHCDVHGNQPAWVKEVDVTLSARVRDMLQYVWPTVKNSSLLDTWKMRDEKMREIGPPCLVLSLSKLEELGRIPAYNEGHALTLSEAAEIAKASGKRFFLEMFSHRWCSKDGPDDEANSKAAALIQWGRYRLASGLCSFIWIDYSCIDQQNVSPGVAMLPLYVASCNNCLCYEQLGYESRAWCRIERVLFAAFCAPTQDIIGMGYTYSGNPKEEPITDTMLALTNPAEGSLSYTGDMVLIKEVTDIASEQWGLCWKDGLYDLVTKNRMAGADSLHFDHTQVRARFFTRLDTRRSSNGEMTYWSQTARSRASDQEMMVILRAGAVPQRRRLAVFMPKRVSTALSDVAIFHRNSRNSRTSRTSRTSSSSSNSRNTRSTTASETQKRARMMSWELPEADSSSQLKVKVNLAAPTQPKSPLPRRRWGSRMGSFAIPEGSPLKIERGQSWLSGSAKRLVERSRTFMSPEQQVATPSGEPPVEASGS
jgi:hypothetical protein